MVKTRVLLGIQRASVEGLLCARPRAGLPEYRQTALDSGTVCSNWRDTICFLCLKIYFIEVGDS